MLKHLPVAAAAFAAVALSLPATAVPAAAQSDRVPATLTASVTTAAATQSAAVPKPKTAGIDVSNHQGRINWQKVHASGVQFAYIKATEGAKTRDKSFNYNYTQATKAKVIRGAYHYARPGTATAKRQAAHFAQHGGGWSKDNRTLPGQLDMEVRGNTNPCYGLTKAQMVRWIKDFVNEYHKRTGRWAVIYTNRNFWSTCTGNSSAFRKNHPLMMAQYKVNKPGTLAGWGTHSIWQYSQTGRVAGIRGDVDLDSFNGSRSRLLALANNTR